MNADRESWVFAAKTILNSFFSNDLSDVLIIVSRYFGRIMLGIPGFNHAYKSAPKNAIGHEEIIIKTTAETYVI